MRIFTDILAVIALLFALCLVVFTAVYFAVGAPQLSASWPHIIQAWVSSAVFVGASFFLRKMAHE